MWLLQFTAYPFSKQTSGFNLGPIKIVTRFALMRRPRMSVSDGVLLFPSPLFTPLSPLFSLSFFHPERIIKDSWDTSEGSCRTPVFCCFTSFPLFSNLINIWKSHSLFILHQRAGVCALSYLTFCGTSQKEKLAWITPLIQMLWLFFLVG